MNDSDSNAHVAVSTVTALVRGAEDGAGLLLGAWSSSAQGEGQGQGGGAALSGVEEYGMGPQLIVWAISQINIECTCVCMCA